MPRYSLKRLLIIVTLVACGLGIARGCYSFLTHVEMAENVASVSWLPASATNVSYYRSYNFTAFEFDISEAEFRKWARRSELRPIGEPFEIMRFSCFSPSVRAAGPNLTGAEWVQLQELRYARVTDGLFHEHRSHNGGGIALAYDRSRGRAYYQDNPR